MKRVLAAVLLCVVLLPACLTVGRDFPSGRVAEIALERTAKPDLEAMFGPPYQRGLEDGRETWTWVWIRYGGSTRSKELHVKFDESGKVASYSFSSSLPEDTR